MKSNDFKAYIPVELIKGKDSKGNTIMKMRGVASTPSKDSDEEYLEPVGFDSEYFLKYGFMNWNHQTNNDPSSIVGRPTSAVVKGDQYIIDFNLFPDSKKAQEIYQLQQVLESQGLSLGLSIEGKVLERDPKNNAIVKKARITGCAITPNPKNQDTVAQIMKGNHYDSLIDADEEETEKSMSIGSDSGQAIAKESLDGDLKSTIKKKRSKKFKKSEVIEKISIDLPHLKKETIQSVFDLTVRIQKSMDMNDNKKAEETIISEDAISKAYQILEIAEKEVKGAEVDEVVKAESPKAIADMTPEERTAFKAELQKGLEDLEALETPEVAEELEKGEETADIQGAEVEEELEKANTEETVLGATKPEAVNQELVKALGDLFKGELDGLKNESNEKFAAVGRIVKGMTEQFEGLTEKVAKLENFNPGPKSVRTQKQHVIEKSFASEELGDQKKVYNAKQNRTLISKALTDDFIANDPDNEQLRKSILVFDQSGELNGLARQKAEQLFKAEFN